MSLDPATGATVYDPNAKRRHIGTKCRQTALDRFEAEYVQPIRDALSAECALSAQLAEALRLLVYRTECEADGDVIGPEDIAEARTALDAFGAARKEG